VTDKKAFDELQMLGVMAIPVTLVDWHTIIGFDMVKLNAALGLSPPDRVVTLFKFVRESDHACFRCQLRDRGTWQAQFLFNGRFRFSRRFDTKEQAAQWAELEREHIEKGGE
jgi:hypothetical protein